MHHHFHLRLYHCESMHLHRRQWPDPIAYIPVGRERPDDDGDKLECTAMHDPCDERRVQLKRVLRLAMKLKEEGRAMSATWKANEIV